MKTQSWTFQALSLPSFRSLTRHAGLLASVAAMTLCLLSGSDTYAQQSTPPPQSEEVDEHIEAWKAVPAPGVALPITSAAWNDNFGAQIAALLASPNEAVRSTMLQNVIHFANNDAYALDLSETMPALLDIYARDRKEEHRIMAAAALHGIALRNEAFDPAMDTLRELLHGERSKRVRKHTLDVLVDYHWQRKEKLVLSPELYFEFKRLVRAHK